MNKLKFKLNFEKIWVFISLLAITGSLIYLLCSLNWLGISISLLLSLTLTYLIAKNLENNRKKLIEKTTPYFYISAFFSIIFNILSLIILFNNRSSEALISPWKELNPIFFLILIASSLFTLLSLAYKAKKQYKLFILSLYLLNIFSISAIIYLLGYGFDPHIHYAAIKQILQDGFILPKTPYYLGQYSLAIFFHKIFGVNLSLINTWLVPLGAALSLPHLLQYLHQKRNEKVSVWIASLLLVLLGFAPFIITTPQNLSYLFLVASIVFIYKNAPPSLIITSALATLSIHPLAGIPAILITIVYLLKQKEKINKIITHTLKPINLSIIFILILSLSIWSISGFSLPVLNNFSLNLTLPIFKNSNSYSLNLAYFFINNQSWLIIFLATLTLFLRKKIWHAREEKERQNALLLSLFSFASLATYLITSIFKFPALIAYEQDGYTKRLLIISLIIALPLFWELFYFLSKKTLQLNKNQKIIISLALSLLLVTAVYGSYPRFDKYHNSRGYSTSKSDLASVQKAEEMANKQTYIVLANQQVSAAALREFGFKNRYLKIEGNEVYFYPIPTGGKLYQYFLDMSYQEASKETMIKAMNFAQVDRAYLIINKYWWASDKIIAEAKISADTWQKIGEEQNYLFEYKR